MPQPCPPTLCDFAYAAGERLRDLGTNLVSAVEAETLAPQIAHDIALRAQAIALRLALRAAAATMPEWPADRPLAFDHPALDAALLERQREFSLRTFGPGARAAGVVAHIRKELLEVEAAPADLSEWVDVMILAVDGAMRAGHAPAEVLTGYRAKLERNFARTWPDWRTMPADGPIEHVRAADPALAPKPPQVGDEVDADEVPPGSVAQPIDCGAPVTVRLPNGCGWICCNTDEPLGWAWDLRGFGRGRLLAVGLHDAEARAVARLSQVDALAWCKSRADALAEVAPSLGDGALALSVTLEADEVEP